MATLKISDLSVGDWVKDNYGNYVKVEGIWLGSNFNYHVDARRDGMIDTIVPRNIHPIPITAEILEKNGFERSTSQFIVYHTDKVWISYDKPSETWSVTMYINDFTSNLHANILYIHQLQHALRLAGVDKEINL
jgi:hypothetical protein